MEKMRRLPPSSIPANWLRDLPAFTGMVLVVVVTTTQPAGPFADSLRTLALVLIGLRLIAPLYQWATTRVVVGIRGIEVARGFLGTRRDEIAWRDVGVVEADQPWSYRIWDLSTVRLLPAGDIQSQVKLDGVSRQALEGLRDEVGRSRAEGENAAARGRETPSLVDGTPQELKLRGSGEQSYRASSWDLVITSAVQGRIVAVVAGVAYAGYDLLSNFSFADAITAWVRENILIGGALLVFIVLACTIASIVIRFGGLVINRRGDSVEIQYGLFDRRIRTVGNRALMGAIIRRNTIEMMADRVRVSLITSDGVGGLGQNLVLPSIPRRAAREALALFDPDVVDFRVLDSLGARSLLRATGVLALATAATVGIWQMMTALAWPFWLMVVVVVMTLVVVFTIARLVSTRFLVLSTIVVMHRRLAVDYEERVRADALHVLRVGRTRSTPQRWVRLSYFAGIPRHRSCIALSDHVPAAITAAMNTASSRRGRRFPRVLSPRWKENND